MTAEGEDALEASPENPAQEEDEEVIPTTSNVKEPEPPVDTDEEEEEEEEPPEEDPPEEIPGEDEEPQTEPEAEPEPETDAPKEEETSPPEPEPVPVPASAPKQGATTKKNHIETTIPDDVTMSADPSFVMMKTLEVVHLQRNETNEGAEETKQEEQDEKGKQHQCETRITLVAKPMPSANELLVKVKYSAIDTSIISIGENTAAANYMRDMTTKPIRAGYHFSGTIEAIGPIKGGGKSSSSSFNVGDAVFGHLPYHSKTTQGAFSEFITVPATSCAMKPDDISFQVAAASTCEGMTALQALRDRARLSCGKSVLIVGAGGAVGSAAIGIAKSIGASSVTAVCSTRDVERVQKLGADFVVDRTQADITKKGAFGSNKFDVVFDVPSKYSLWDGMAWMKRNGRFVNTSHEKMDFEFLGWFVALFTRKKFETVRGESKQADLEVLAMWMEEGTVKFEVEETFKICDFDAAWQKFDTPDKTGRVVIQVEDGWE